MSSAGDELVRSIQTAFDAELVAPAPDAIDKADATLLAAARLFYGAVVERLAFMPQRPDYWSSSEPGAAKLAQLRGFEVMGRRVLAELGRSKDPAGATSAASDADAGSASASRDPWSGDAPAPGAIVRDTRLELAWRVIRSRPIVPKSDRRESDEHGGWRCLCERLSGDAAGEQEWIPAAELRPEKPS